MPQEPAVYPTRRYRELHYRRRDGTTIAVPIAVALRDQHVMIVPVCPRCGRAHVHSAGEGTRDAPCGPIYLRPLWARGRYLPWGWTR
jgi:hypothetical protein